MLLLLVMNNNNKHLPYPFLSSDTDDYGTTKIITNIECDISEFGWKLDISINLEDEDLKNKIAKEMAFYHLVIDCKSTGFRKIIKSYETNKRLQVDISKRDIANVISFECFVVANQNFSLSSSNFNTDYKGRTFDVKKSELLAEADEIVLEDPEIADPLEPLSSIIKIQKQPPNNQQDNAYTGLTGANIIIYLNEKDYKNYRNLKGKNEDSILLSMLLIPTLMQAITEIMGEDTTFENNKWYRKVESLIYKIDNKFEDMDKKNWDTFEISQKILDCHIGIALQQRFDYLTDIDD